MNGTLSTVKDHWPEYLIEAWGLGTFMISACVFGVLFFHSDSYFADYSLAFRTLAMGVAMGTTAIAIFKSPWGRRSGAHINPVVTLTFHRLGKVRGVDAIFYAIAQFAGACFGVFIAWLLLGDRLAADEVNYVATVPGVWGLIAAFAGEFVIAFAMMTMVLNTSNHRRLYRFTPFLAGILVALYITFESPISGMSMNPARTLGSAVFADTWTGWWIYFTAPAIAMLAAAEVFVHTRGLKAVLCAKFDHSGTARCIFNCGFHQVVEKRETGNDVARSPLKFKAVKGLF